MTTKIIEMKMQDASKSTKETEEWRISWLNSKQSTIVWMTNMNSLILKWNTQILTRSSPSWNSSSASFSSLLRSSGSFKCTSLSYGRIFGNVVKGFIGDRPLIPMLNELFIHLEDNNVGFLSTAIFAYLCLYMLWAVQKGNIKFGIRIPCCCRFHPMK